MNSFKKWIFDHSTQILTVVGIVGYAGCAYLSAKGYQECCKRLDAKKRELQVEKLPVKEVVKTCWKPLAAPALTFATSTVCIIGAQNIQLKRNADLLALYKGSEFALTEFKKHAKEELTEEKFKEIEQKVNEATVEKQMAVTEVPKKTYLDSDKDLWFDGTYGGYFYATELEIHKAFDETRADLKWAEHTSTTGYHEYIPLNDLYYRLHGDPIGVGDDYGYFVDKYMSNTLDYTITGETKIAPNGKAARVFVYDRAEDVDTYD